jgi:1,2-phenylacetyl-CoA epoxidase PaaB subunit
MATRKSETDMDWRKQPETVVAQEMTDKGQWIDPYATKRNKNYRYNKRKEEKRLQRLQKLAEGEEEEESVKSETYWDD